MQHIINYDSFLLNESISIPNIVRKIRKNLTPDLLKGIWKSDDPKNFTGYCYVAVEALFWILGGPNSDYSPYVIGSKEWPEVLKPGQTHWFLKNKTTGKIIDPTSEQFGDNVIPYERGKANGMMTHPKGGSKRAKILMSRVL